MKKKVLLLPLLILSIVTSLTAGTLAIYTKTLNLGADVVIKKFAFAAAGNIADDATQIKLAPTESQIYNFKVTNYEEDSAVAEVPLNYTVTIDFTDAAAKMPGLIATLSGAGITETLTDNEGIIEHTYQMPAGKEATDNYLLTLTWAGDDNEKHSEAGQRKESIKDLSVTVVATQQI